MEVPPNHPLYDRIFYYKHPFWGNLHIFMPPVSGEIGDVLYHIGQPLT